MDELRNIFLFLHCTKTRTKKTLDFYTANHYNIYMTIIGYMVIVFDKGE